MENFLITVGSVLLLVLVVRALRVQIGTVGRYIGTRVQAAANKKKVAYTFVTLVALAAMMIYNMKEHKASFMDPAEYGVAFVRIFSDWRSFALLVILAFIVMFAITQFGMYFVFVGTMIAIAVVLCWGNAPSTQHVNWQVSRSFEELEPLRVEFEASLRELKKARSSSHPDANDVALKAQVAFERYVTTSFDVIFANSELLEDRLNDLKSRLAVSDSDASKQVNILAMNSAEKSLRELETRLVALRNNAKLVRKEIPALTEWSELTPKKDLTLLEGLRLSRIPKKV